MDVWLSGIVPYSFHPRSRRVFDICFFPVSPILPRLKSNVWGKDARSDWFVRGTCLQTFQSTSAIYQIRAGESRGSSESSSPLLSYKNVIHYSAIKISSLLTHSLTHSDKGTRLNSIGFFLHFLPPTPSACVQNTKIS